MDICMCSTCNAWGKVFVTQNTYWFRRYTRTLITFLILTLVIKVINQSGAAKLGLQFDIIKLHICYVIFYVIQVIRFKTLISFEQRQLWISRWLHHKAEL